MSLSDEKRAALRTQIQSQLALPSFLDVEVKFSADDSLLTVNILEDGDVILSDPKLKVESLLDDPEAVGRLIRTLRENLFEAGILSAP
jgi:hypothetical protein